MELKRLARVTCDPIPLEGEARFNRAYCADQTFVVRPLLIILRAPSRYAIPAMSAWPSGFLRHPILWMEIVRESQGTSLND